MEYGVWVGIIYKFQYLEDYFILKKPQQLSLAFIFHHVNLLMEVDSYIGY